MREKGVAGPGGTRKRTAFPRPCGTVPRRPAGPGTTRGQRPPVAGRALAGAFGPRRARDQRGAVAGAMAPAMTAGLAVRTLIFRPQSGREQETHCVSPARARRCHQDPRNPHQQRPAPDPAGEKRPPWAGRALAGGFGPPARQGSAWRCGRGDGPCHGNGAGGSDSDRPRPLRAGKGNACVSPARAGRFPVDRQVREKQKASARPGGREAPAGGGAGAGRGLWAPGGPGISGTLWQGRWPLPGCARRAQAEGYPAFRSGSPCGRPFFSTLLAPGARVGHGTHMAGATAADRTRGPVFCSLVRSRPGAVRQKCRRCRTSNRLSHRS